MLVLLLLLLLDGRLGGLRLRLRSGLGLDRDLYLLRRLWLRGDGRSWCLLWPRLLLGLMCLLGGCGLGLGLVGLGLGLVWLVGLVSLVCDVLRLVSQRLMSGSGLVGLVCRRGCRLLLLCLVLLRLVRDVALRCLVGRMGLVTRVRLLMLLEVLVRLVRLMRLCLVRLVGLVGHDALAVHGLAHLVLAVHHRGRLLAGRGGALPGLDDRAGDLVALGPSRGRVGDIAVDAGLVEKVMGVCGLRGLLGRVGLLLLLLVGRGGVRHGGGLVLGGSMVWLLEGASSHAGNLGEGQARMGGGSRLPQGGHDGRGRWQEGRAASRERKPRVGSPTSGEEGKRTKETTGKH